MLKVTRRIMDVAIILNQQVAEDIARLGDALAEETTREQITEPGRTGRRRPPRGASKSYANRRMRRH